ncbi:polysaccharide deacetylase family protein [Streptosporangium sp. NBC_01755]|uniref:polysaccharide deacetylase family protein n=1 Tax=unclassified Streptosporangium TaxID=2632669 RepID=UPI002DD95BB6|nr:MULTISPECIES: polysaccharide deacetylase family protein [unclassified Streptosporangium]WSA24366.1 polysaccharide deacetylase family protein [Streptosporangium sp. NBC_01810]WSC97560.1 polysaccharide deacetylase family protein [Streptosporangium sp. NBC_01755]
MKSPVRMLLATSCALAMIATPTAAWSADQPKTTGTTKATGKAKPAPKPVPVDCAKVKCIALTFDDGPGKYADKLLDTFKKYKSKATFFLEGQYVKSRPAFAKRMVAEGHDIGNHSYSHPHLREVSEDKIREELDKTQDIVKKVTGKYPAAIRPPYGEFDQRVTAIAIEMGMPIYLWNGGSRDWATRNEKAIYDEVLKNAKRDGVILMHDWVEQTVKVMPKLLTALQKQGYHVVAISSLRGAKATKAGEVYPVGSEKDDGLISDSPTGDPDDFAESPADGT